MFQLDEILKSKVLSKLSPDSKLYFLLNRYWSQLVLYMLTAPLQWLHLTHLLYNTDWETYGSLSKMLMIFYAASCFFFWECVRIFVYYTCRAVATGEDVKGIAMRVASVIGKEGAKRAGPMLASLSQSARELISKNLEGAQEQSINH